MVGKHFAASGKAKEGIREYFLLKIKQESFED